MAKDTCEGSRALRTSFLKKYGYFNDDYHSGRVIWTNSWGEENSIGVESHPFDTFPFIRLHYTRTLFDGEKEPMDYRVQLETTKPFLGGTRYWFICPLIRNDIPCERRVAVLYGAGKYYGCRHCYDLAYQSQQETHTGALATLGKIIFGGISDKEEKIRVKYWRGQPTKRYARLIRKMEKQPPIEAVMAAETALLSRLRKP